MFENLGVKQGLPATEVYNLYQDRDGYVWIFTEYGIVKHNGSKFIPVCTNIPLKESAVYAFDESPSGNLFFANSRANIYQVKDDKAIRVKGFESVTKQITQKSEPIINLFIDDFNRLYFSTLEKTYTIAKKNYRVVKNDAKRKHPVKPFKLQPNANYVEKKRSKRGITYLSVRDRKGNRLVDIKGKLLNNTRTSCVSKGELHYVFFDDELRLYKKDKEIKSYHFEQVIINLDIAPNGHLWVSLSGGGLQELSAGLKPLEHYLDQTTVSDVLFDNQSGMWVSTTGKGVYYCSNTDNYSFRELPGLNERITTINVIENKLFIGTSTGKLFVRKDGRLNQIILKDNPYCINDIVMYNGKYYIGTKGDTYILDKTYRQVGIHHESTYAFRKAYDGSLIMVSGSLVLQIRKGETECRTIQANYWNRCIAERSPNEYFVVLREELSCINPSFDSEKCLKELQGKNISRIKVDSKKRLWVCTKGDGLYCLTLKNQLIHYPNGPSNVINDITFLHGDIILLSTNKGAFVNTLNNINEKNAWKLLLNEEATRIAVSGKKVFIGTTSGLTVMDSKKLFKSLNYNFYLSSVSNRNQSVLINKALTLNHRQNDLYFNFDLLIYGDYEKKLSYRLNGPYALSGEVKGTQVHLQNLSPGKYTLYASPHMNLLRGRKREIITSFYIQPAFWQTKLFMILCICFGVAFTVVSCWWLMQRKRKKEAQRNQIEKLLTQYHLTALKAQVNPHFISNSLVAIQHLVVQNETRKANQYIAKFSMFIRYLLNYSDQSVTSLLNELKIIDLYVELEQLRFSNAFVFKREIDESIQADQVFIPALITQPLIENAIWHGLLPLEGKRIPELTLTITNDSQMLYVSIVDNGVGRTHQEGTKFGEDMRISKGTQLIVKRMENLNRLYGTNEGRLDIIDRVDEEGKPEGTIVRLQFPVGMLNKLFDESNQEYYH